MVDDASSARAFGTAANGPKTNPNTRRTRTWPISRRRTIMLSVIARPSHRRKQQADHSRSRLRHCKVSRLPASIGAGSLQPPIPGSVSRRSPTLDSPPTQR